MSYSFTTTTPRSSLRKSLDEAAATVHADPEVDDERTEHIVAALGAVEDLAEHIGRLEDDLFVSVSGHANPGHGPREGWSDETIAVTVSARPAKATPA